MQMSSASHRNGKVKSCLYFVFRRLQFVFAFELADNDLLQNLNTFTVKLNSNQLVQINTV
jgi:hypothetical protein